MGGGPQEVQALQAQLDDAVEAMFRLSSGPHSGAARPVRRRAARVSASAIQTLFVSVHTATKINRLLIQIWGFIRMY